MSRLADMEELISIVAAPAAGILMREAYASYGAGAYRGCVVLVHIALYEHFKLEIEDLAAFNSSARDILDDIRKKEKSRSPYERDLVARLKSEDFISATEKDLLESLMLSRHRAAHPTGHATSPEEARFVFRTAAEQFLSKKLYQTKPAIDGIIVRLKASQMFTGRTDDDKLIAQAEIEGVRAIGYSHLISSLVEALSDSGATDVFKANAASLLVLGGQIAPPTWLQALAAVVRRSVLLLGGHDELIAELVTANPGFVGALSEIEQVRLCECLKRVAASKAVTPTATFSFGPKRRAQGRSTRFLSEQYKAAAEAFSKEFREGQECFREYRALALQKLCYDPEMIRVSLVDVSAKELLFSLWAKNAGSSNFDTANEFVRKFAAVESLGAEILSDGQALEILHAVYTASEGGAWGAKDAVKSGFASYPALLEKAARHLDEGDRGYEPGFCEAIAQVPSKEGGAF